MAASDNTPDPQKQISMIAKAVGMDPNLLGKIGALLGLDASATPDDVKKAIEDFSAKMDQITALLDKGAPGDGAAPATEPGDAAPNPADSAPAMAAASARLIKLTGRQTASEALTDVETWRASHIEREQEIAKLAAERSALEAGERRSLVAELVKLGRETPATAWEDVDEKIPTKPAKLYADMALATLRDRVAKLRAGAPGTNLTPPTGDAPTGAHGLSERELAICEDAGCDPAVFAKLKATHTPAARS